MRKQKTLRADLDAVPLRSIKTRFARFDGSRRVLVCLWLIFPQFDWQVHMRFPVQLDSSWQKPVFTSYIEINTSELLILVSNQGSGCVDGLLEMLNTPTHQVMHIQSNFVPSQVHIT